MKRFKKMTCKECRKLIIKYTYGEASAREQEKIDKHIDNCEDCWSEIFVCNRLMNLISDLPETQPSPFFESSLRAKLRQAKAYNEPKQWFRSKKLTFIGVISLVLILVFGLYVYMENHEKDDLLTLTGIENELIGYNNSGEDNFKHFVMPSVNFYENIHTEYNERKNYVLTSINTSDDANYILDKIIVHQNDIINENIARGRR